ncbi:PREDICTED: tripartite motif-containing protein 16-like [Poecilia mexicana]|uniref:tripartite motif-containing protein 16-like n=1 Tax=Poecilia mexicana TaxID=48701 RepID=UPI00072E6DD2|nr:PREDICTED: tripartite motif-containing protein 16-like [Poecilia mexicana]
MCCPLPCVERVQSCDSGSEPHEALSDRHAQPSLSLPDIITPDNRTINDHRADLRGMPVLTGSDRLVPSGGHEKLEQEITELKRKDAELEQLSHTEDHNQFLLNYPSLPALSESTHSSSINIRPLRHFEDVTTAVSELRDKLQDVLRDSWTNISLMVTEVDVLLAEPEPKSRAGFLRYSCEITLDPNTANTELRLSEGNRKVTWMDQDQFYSSHPDRFTYYYQVLSRESLTGRCYWEVEWRGRVNVSVAYKSISRAGWGDECAFGYNDKSWALVCSQSESRFGHNNIWTSISGPGSSRVGVYLDHRAGILSFYSVSETRTLLHRVQTRFTEPLLAGVRVGWTGGSAEFCKTS